MAFVVVAVPKAHHAAVTVDHPRVITVHAPLGDQRESGIGRSLFHQAGAGTVDNRAVSTIDAIAMLVTDQITDVIVDDAARMPPRALDWIAHATLAASTHLTLAHRAPFNPDIRQWLTGWPHSTRSLARVQARWRHPATPTPPATHPNVPDSDWPWFRTDLHRLLTPADAATADRTYLHALGNARTRFAAHHYPCSDETITIIRSLLTGINDPNHALTIVRGCAAAAFEAGISITVNPTHFRAVHTSDSQPTPARADRAIAIGASASGIPLGELAEYTVADADRLQHHIARPYRRDVQRQALSRHLQGALPTDPLVTTPTGQPSSIRALTQAVQRNRPRAPTNPYGHGAHSTPNTRWAAHTTVRAHRYRPT